MEVIGWIYQWLQIWDRSCWEFSEGLVVEFYKHRCSNLASIACALFYPRGLLSMELRNTTCLNLDSKYVLINERISYQWLDVIKPSVFYRFDDLSAVFEFETSDVFLCSPTTLFKTCWRAVDLTSICLLLQKLSQTPSLKLWDNRTTVWTASVVKTSYATRWITNIEGTHVFFKVWLVFVFQQVATVATISLIEQTLGTELNITHSV